jgi:hypothetical protein
MILRKHEWLALSAQNRPTVSDVRTDYVVSYYQNYVSHRAAVSTSVRYLLTKLHIRVLNALFVKISSYSYQRVMDEAEKVFLRVELGSLEIGSKILY